MKRRKGQHEDVEEDQRRGPFRVSRARSMFTKVALENGVGENIDGAPAAAPAAKAEIPQPSKLAEATEWLPFRYLGEEPRWKCYRGPPSAQPQIPVALLHQSFEEFAKNLEVQEHAEVEEAPPGESRARSIPDVARKARLGRLGLDEEDMKVTCKVWDVAWEIGVPLSEEKGLTEPLNIAFENYLDCLINHAFHAIGYQHLNAMVGIEDKGGLLQVLECFRKAWRHNSVKKGQRISHGIAVLRALPTIQFFAIVMDWTSTDPTDPAGVILAEPLTDAMCCYGPTDLGVFKVARAMKALKAFVNSYHPVDYIDCSVPYLLGNWTSVKRLSETKNQDKMVFCGVVAQGVVRVAKFCSAYSEDAHRAWSQAGHAPELHEVTRLASGWFFVVMDYLTGDWKPATDEAERYKKNSVELDVLCSSILEAVKRGHDTGFVHGDARLDNIFVQETFPRGFQVQFVDFGWAGVQDSDVYPEMVNPKIKWHKDVKFGAVLKKDHDITLVSNEIDYYK